MYAESIAKLIADLEVLAEEAEKVAHDYNVKDDLPMWAAYLGKVDGYNYAAHELRKILEKGKEVRQ